MSIAELLYSNIFRAPRLQGSKGRAWELYGFCRASHVARAASPFANSAWHSCDTITRKPKVFVIANEGTIRHCAIAQLTLAGRSYHARKIYFHTKYPGLRAAGGLFFSHTYHIS